MGGRGARDEINVGHVRGERGKILLNGLVVANVSQHAIKYWQLRYFSGDRNARLRHQSQQSNGLQPNRFSTGVGTADDELAVSAVQLHRERHDLSTAIAQVALQQWMPRSM